MAASFVFEPPSDEEIELSEAEDEEQVDEEEEAEAEEGGSKPSNRHSQSPWDFASYSESVAEEHARRSTTSVDFKISKALQQRSVPADADAGADEDNESSESEPDRQVRLSLFFFPKLLKTLGIFEKD